MEGLLILDLTLQKQCATLTEKQMHAIILSCKMARHHGPQFTEMLRTKLSKINPLYHFLSSDSDLYALYSAFISLPDSAFRSVLISLGLESQSQHKGGNNALSLLAEYYNSDSDEDCSNRRKDIQSIDSTVSNSDSNNNVNVAGLSNHTNSTGGNIPLDLTSQMKKAERLRRAKSLVSYFSDFIDSTTKNNSDDASTTDPTSGELEADQWGCELPTLTESSKKRGISSTFSEHGERSSGISSRRRVDHEMTDRSSRDSKGDDILNSIEIDGRISQAAENIIGSRYSHEGVGTLLGLAISNMNFKLGLK